MNKSGTTSKSDYRLRRQKPTAIAELIKQYLKSNSLNTAFNTHLVFSAWDDASGAAQYTVKKFFRDGKLYVTVSSSVVRSQLLFQKSALTDKMNAIVSSNELFCGPSGCRYVKDLIIK